MTNWKTTEKWDDKEIQALFDAIDSLDLEPATTSTEEYDDLVLDDIPLSPELEAIFSDLEDVDPFNYI